MVEWLAGNRLRGTSAEKPVSGLASPSVGGWVEVGRTTLGSAGDDIDVTGFADKRYYMILMDTQPSGRTQWTQTVGNTTFDTGANYAFRFSVNGATDTATANASSLEMGAEINALYTDPKFGVAYIANLSSKEKLMQSLVVAQNAASASTAPDRDENVSKWTNTSNPIDRFRLHNIETGSFNTGSEVVVLGWDPTDTHTTNFWEELASVDLSGGSADTLSSGTFTAKKYLWIQAYTTATGGTTNPYFRVGNTTLDTGSNYAIRYSTNGAADSTLTSQGNIPLDGVTLATGESSLSNFFIINNASNEKLIIHSSVESEAAGAAAAPSRIELASKWVNTSNQIDIVGLNNVSGTGDFGTETMIKVWGSN